jgi:signal transduction histidine kinase
MWDTAGSAAAWAWVAALAAVVLALLLAGAAWQLGRQSERAAAKRELRLLRHELRLMQRCAAPATPTGPPALWRSDAAGALVGAAGPGDPPLDPGRATPELRAALRSQRPIEGLLLPATGSAPGLRVHAEPLLDDAGRFSGYVGVALPEAASASGVAAFGTATLGTAASAASAPEAAAAAPPPAQAPHALEGENFVFTLSHDLRAPIRVVEGFTRILKEDYGPRLDRVGNDHLERVLGAAARMNLMIDALLTLAKLSQQPLQRQPVNLSQMAGWVVEELRRSAPEREADVHIAEGLHTRGDPTLLRLVLENLLGNAWKYSSRALRSTIALERVGSGGDTFVVRDNGAGFDMRNAERLFGLFQRLHSASEFPGHGVGLASVRRIVQRHGGQIWAEAEPGRGAAFYFTLG